MKKIIITTPRRGIRSLCEEGLRDEATTATLEVYGPGILGMLLHAVGDEDEAGDIFSLWTIDVWNGLGKFRWQSRLRTWTYRLACNALSRYKRKVHHRLGRPFLTQDEPAEEALSQVLRARLRETTQRWRKTSTRDRFRAIREQLSPEDNMLLVLHIDRGMPWNEIALVLMEDDPSPEGLDLKASANRLRQRFHRLKRRLRALAEKEGLLTAS